MDKVTTEGHIDNRKTKGNTEGQDYSGAKRKWRRGGIDYGSTHGKTYNCKSDI